MLQCEAQGEKPIGILWNMNNKRLDPKSDSRYTIREEILANGVLSDLSIKRTERSDSALFTCVATNAFGSDDTSINMIVQGSSLFSPSTPFSPVYELRITFPRRGTRGSVRFEGVGQIRTLGSTFLGGALRREQPDQALRDRVQDQQRLVGDRYRQSSGARIPAERSRSVQSQTRHHLPPQNRGRERNRRVRPVRHGHHNHCRGGAQRPANLHPRRRPRPAHPQGTASASSLPLFLSFFLQFLSFRYEFFSTQVTWKPPPREDWNGEILGYYVGYRLSSSEKPYMFETVDFSKEDGKEHHLQIMNLKTYTQYSVVVQAFNKVGSGPMSEERRQHTAEGVPEQPPHDTTCTTLTSQTIRISWMSPPLSAANGVITGYKVIVVLPYPSTSRVFECYIPRHPGHLRTLRHLVRREHQGHQDHLLERDHFARIEEVHELQHASLGFHFWRRRCQVRAHSLPNRAGR